MPRKTLKAIFRVWFDRKSVHLCFHYRGGNNLYFNITKNKTKSKAVA
jgi:hypothetical protein